MTIHSAKTASAANAETAAGRAIATRTATAEILPHADLEIDQGRQRGDPEVQAALNGRKIAEITIETVTLEDGRRSDTEIATVAGIATTVGTTVMVIAVEGTGHGMATEIREEKGRKRKKRSPSLLLLREVKR